MIGLDLNATYPTSTNQKVPYIVPSTLNIFGSLCRKC